MKLSVFDILKVNEGPMTVPQILDEFNKKGLFPNKTTVYRQIQKLEDAHVVNKVILTNGIAFYEVSDEHHHHFFCTECKAIFCMENTAIETDIHRFEKDLTKQNFKTTRHEFNLYGTCEKCSL